MEPLRLITQPESWAREAQPGLVEQLEIWLAAAKAGEIIGVAMAAECSDGLIMTGLTPSRHRGLLIGAVAHLQYRLNKVMDEA